MYTTKTITAINNPSYKFNLSTLVITFSFSLGVLQNYDHSNIIFAQQSQLKTASMQLSYRGYALGSCIGMMS